eukprot:366349-Chlamydomonas_euryale.AAC.9
MALWLFRHGRLTGHALKRLCSHFAFARVVVDGGRGFVVRMMVEHGMNKATTANGWLEIQKGYCLCSGTALKLAQVVCPRRMLVRWNFADSSLHLRLRLRYMVSVVGDDACCTIGCTKGKVHVALMDAWSCNCKLIGYVKVRVFSPVEEGAAAAA